MRRGGRLAFGATGLALAALIVRLWGRVIEFGFGLRWERED